MTLYLHKWTEDQYQFLKDNIKGRQRDELTKMFNEHFGLDLNLSRIKAACDRKGYRSGLEGHFPKGHTPFNKGRKGEGVNGWSSTRFKKGTIPPNYKPVGSTRVTRDGYIEIKVSDTAPTSSKRWVGKHRILWEEANGPIPKGYVVIFGDGDKRNFDLDNLLLVSRGQLAVMNKRGFIYNDAELTKIGITLSEVQMEITKRVKERKGKKS